jgi:hypothetical protein
MHAHAPSTTKDTKIVILSYITTKYNFLSVFFSALFLFLSTRDTNQIRMLMLQIITITTTRTSVNYRLVKFQYAFAPAPHIMYGHHTNSILDIFLCRCCSGYCTIIGFLPWNQESSSGFPVKIQMSIIHMNVVWFVCIFSSLNVMKFNGGNIL